MSPLLGVIQLPAMETNPISWFISLLVLLNKCVHSLIPLKIQCGASQPPDEVTFTSERLLKPAALTFGGTECI